ncbi:MAG: PQQ-binding-like beta-propeller repeat protein [Candidatus Bathyarchaeota archaeon]|nr:PQQ-binding-like beta-propeller repeat protein [Candidatus Bathyarchaeota archaeon]
MKKNYTTIAFLGITILAIMLLSSIASPFADAHTPIYKITSYAYIMVEPNPVGVGQSMAVVMWIDSPLPGATVENDVRRHDYTLTITKPDGKTETQHWDVIADTTSVQYYKYTPDQVGTYQFSFEYAEQTFTWSGEYQGDIFLGASKSTNLTVQEDPIADPIDSYPLPAEYWTYPIEGQNTYWYSISSNWLGEPYIVSGAAIGSGTSGNYFGRIQPNGIAPNSPHIMWTKPIQAGGLVAGNSTGISGEMFYTGSSYNTRFQNAIIMQGTLYYQEPYGNSGTGGYFVAVNLRTGQELWRTNVTATGAPAFGYLYASDGPNQHGVLSNGLLFTNNFASSYDALTGEVTPMKVTNVPSTDTVLASVAGPSGEIIRYKVVNIGNTTNPNWRLLQWNSSKTVGYLSGTGIGGWYSGTIDAGLASRFDYNVSLNLPNSGSWRVDRASLDNMLLLVQGTFGAHTTVSDGANLTAVSLKPNSYGQILWTKNFAPAAGNITVALTSWDVDKNVFVLSYRETNTMKGYSLTDGSLLWTTEPTNDYTYFRQLPTAAYGKLYYSGYGGILYCYDIKTGGLLWTYGNGGEGNTTYAGFTTPYGSYPIFVDVIADGKVYLGSTEHSPDSPYYKNAQFRCLNATDGTEIWTMMGWGTGMDAAGYDRVADGFFIYLNCYDMQIYNVGKGPSEITVDAPATSTNLGKSLTIRGTVTDIAAGTQQEEQAARFPKGVPAVSDESMSSWMEYVYMQKPRPTDVTGVQVTLSVLDANGNYREIGTTTSDADGFYSMNYTPDIEGKYTLYASFAGSESYWPSHAVTAFTVDPADATPAPTQPAPDSIADMYFIPAIAGLFVAIIVVGAMMMLIMLKKRP